MKKILKFTFAFMLTLTCFSSLAHADTGYTPGAGADSSQGGIFTPPSYDNILNEGEIVKNTVPAVINYIIGILGTVAFVSFMYSGISLVIFAENEDEIGKNKHNMIFSIVGLAVAGLAFIIINNVVTIIKPL